MKYLRISLAATVALLLMAGCGTLGDVLGTGNNYPSNTQTQTLSGTVNYIDTNARRIDMNSNGYTQSVYWDSRTQFTYQNQNVNPNAIRSGDYVTVQASNSGGQLLAQNVNDTGNGMASGSPGNTYPSTNGSFNLQGTVSYVDTTAQRIDITSAYATGLRTNGTQGTYSIYYDSRTPVYYQGQTYSPTALERGDQIQVSAYDNGNGRYLANSITVTRNVRQ
jgi:Domain of unknown function (DUF5666)